MGRTFGLRGNKVTVGHICTVIIPAYICFGYLNAVSSGITNRQSFVTTFPQLDTVNATGSKEQENSRIEGTVVALFNLGCLFSAIGCIFIGDKLGRKRTVMLGLTGTIIGSILQSTAYTLPHLIVGRLVTGLGFGAVSATAPNWQSETTTHKLRGFIVMLQSGFLAIGLATAGWIEYGLAFTEGPVVWRLPLAIPCFFCLVSLVFTPCWPESPRWLIKAGRIDEAREVLSILLDKVPEDEAVVHQIEEIEASLQETGKGSFKDILRNGPGRFGNRAGIAIATQMAQQVCGQNAITFYQSTIFKKFVGMSGNLSLLMSAVLFSWKILVSPFGVFTVDKAGRRKLLILSFVGMGICMAVMAGCMSQPGNKNAANTAVAFIFLYVFFYVTGCIGLTYLYCSEIAPLAVRTQITGMSTASSWAFNFLVVEVTPVGFSTIGWKYFIVYAAINFFLIVPMVYLFFPETKGLPLEAIDNIFLDSKNVFHPVRTARRMRKRTSLTGASDEVQIPGEGKSRNEHREYITKNDV
ncbi:general substrate transporter [Aspergillus filifer]